MPFVRSNNTELYYTEYGSGKPIIVLHGGPGVDHKYMLNLKSLSKKYRLIFIDQRGNGKSKITNYNTLRFDYFTSDVDNIRKHLSINKCAIIGHSFGGFVALEYAIHYNQFVTKLLLIDTGFNAAQVQEESPKILRNWGYSESVSNWAYKFFNGKLNLFQIPYAFLRFGKAYCYKYNLAILKKSMSGKHTLKTVYLWFQRYFKGWDIQNKLNLIKASTIIIAGEKDFQFPPEYQKLMAQGIRNSQLHIIKKAGHNTLLECPEKINRIILNYLNQNSA